MCEVIRYMNLFEIGTPSSVGVTRCCLKTIQGILEFLSVKGFHLLSDQSGISPFSPGRCKSHQRLNATQSI